MKNLIYISIFAILLTSFTVIKSKCDLPFPDGKHLINTDEAGKNIAMEGYDLVTIYSDKKLTEGNAKFSSVNNGITYLFSSESNKTKFDAKPEMYKPQFGGFCTVAASFGKAEELSTFELFDVRDGKLYFSKNKMAHNMYEKKPQKVINKANNRWNCIVTDLGLDISEPYKEPASIK